MGSSSSVHVIQQRQIQKLKSMLFTTLSPDVHTSWARGKFTLEPLVAEANRYGLRARFQWMPQKSESPKELGIVADPTSIEPIPLTIGTSLFNGETALRSWMAI